MAFENAIITKEDDEKYGLSEIYYKCNPLYKTLPSQKGWIIDKKLDCWIMKTQLFNDPEIDHAYLSKAMWKFYYKGDIFDIVLDYRLDEKVSGIQYNKVWKVLSIVPNGSEKISVDEIFSLLKEQLIVFGLDGLYKQGENYKVTLIDARKG